MYVTRLPSLCLKLRLSVVMGSPSYNHLFHSWCGGFLLLWPVSFFLALSFSTPHYLCLRWSGFLFCAVAMLLVIFPMFAFPKKLPPRHKKSNRKKKCMRDLPSDDEVMKEKSQAISSSIGFGKDIKGKPSAPVLAFAQNAIGIKGFSWVYLLRFCFCGDLSVIYFFIFLSLYPCRYAQGSLAYPE